ncbi:MAG: M48 family metallopeptidase [Oscillibacter sp.]|jgi:predicted metal-dependent hydrolase|nr:M48 family metallopeptidase [Oscillibacter sp.]
MLHYTLIRSGRRTVSLEIDKSCRLLVRAPQRMPREDIDAFVAAHRRWADTHLARCRARQAAAPPPPTPEEIAALKRRAGAVLPEKVARWARILGLTPASVKITSARTRYGSCSGRDGLCFSCFLMNSPDDAVELVVVHELCHIRYKNHGPQFYALLSRALPDWRERKKLLTMERTEGGTL